MVTSSIKYIPSSQVNKGKWDRCIDTAANGLVYAYSYYLDHMSRHWDALVMGDYEAVMPLTWNKKYGIHYLYQPFLAAQLGVFGKETNADLVENFLDAIPEKFRYWDIYLNHQNRFELKNYDLYERTNYVLSLSEDYSTISSRYRETTRRNIKKALQLGCIAVKDIEISKVAQLASIQMKMPAGKFKEGMNQFSSLYKYMRDKGNAVTYGIQTGAGELVATAVFIFSHRRAYYILVGNHPNGRTLGASHALIDAFIEDHAGNDLLLDFEGSDIRNLAFFYSSFGAREEKYAGLMVNRLPFYLRWMK